MPLLVLVAEKKKRWRANCWYGRVNSVSAAPHIFPSTLHAALNVAQHLQIVSGGNTFKMVHSTGGL